MSTRVVERVDDWDDEPFSDGFRGLHDLAEEVFSGVVRGGGAELYMTKGVVVGILQGDIDDFKGASGTAFEAPSDALPLLAIMQEENDEVRAEYYSEKTSITEVDSTLESGGFTGFIELSENVLSGDYYIVYHGGQSMSVAYVGQAKRLLDEDEAFERADDEVGIFEVKPVDIEPIEVPEVEAPSANEGATTPEPSHKDGSGADEAEESTKGDASEDGESAASTTEPAETAVDSADDTGSAASAEETDVQPSALGDGADAGDARGDTSRPETEAAQTQTAAERDGSVAGGADTTDTSGTASVAESRGSETAHGGGGAVTRQPPRSEQQSTGAGGGQGGSQTHRSSRDLETRSVPSLDPERTQERSTNSGGGARRDTVTQHEQSGQTRPAGPQSQQPKVAPETESVDAQEQSGTTGESEKVPDEELEELSGELKAANEAVERLESELEETGEERDELEAELEAVRAERDELTTEVERLQSQLEQLETELGAATDAEQRLTPREALAGTDIFFRYGSKGDATLEKAHAGGVRKKDVIANLELERHTQFDASSVAVGGQNYDQFIDGSPAYQFVEWVATELLFEIWDTKHTKELQDLYDAIPKIDRAEFDGVIGVTYTEDGQETHSEESFDVVLRDRMGDPLLVANMNDSREGATQSMMEDLLTAAARVGQSSDGFAGAYLVTKSFFEPEALEVADSATSGGLLSRGKRRSFVNITRKSGYHLCLVEARNANHNLVVPEL